MPRLSHLRWWIRSVKAAVFNGFLQTVGWAGADLQQSSDEESANAIRCSQNPVRCFLVVFDRHQSRMGSVSNSSVDINTPLLLCKRHAALHLPISSCKLTSIQDIRRHDTAMYRAHKLPICQAEVGRRRRRHTWVVNDGYKLPVTSNLKPVQL